MVIVLYSLDKSPPVRAVQILGKALNLEFTEKPLDLLKKEHLTPEFLKINPVHTVPTIDDDGFIVWDSHAIALYLVSKYAKNDSLYPNDYKIRATIEQRMQFDGSYLFARIVNAVRPVFYRGEKTIPDEKKQDIKETYEFMEKFLEKSKWMAADQVTIADICMIASVTTLNVIVPIDAKFGKLLQWIENCKALPYYSVNESGLNAFEKMLKSLIN